MLYCPEYWELVQFVLQNCEKLHSFRGLYDKKKRQRLIVLFTSDVMYKKYKRPAYTPPALARSFCKINLSHTKNSASLFILASLLDKGMQHDLQRVN